MIGFFDSGLGGLTILKEVVKILPEYSYVYLGDNARTPYGSRSQEIIYQYTCEGIEELFSRGATLVVLACNTASAVALRKIQQEYLPKYHPDKKVLGIFNPTVEKVKEFQSNIIGLFATEATVNSKAFEREIAKTSSEAIVIQQACPLLVPIIESGEFDQLEIIVSKYVNELFEKGNIGTVILGCTHYAIIENLFRKFIPPNVEIITQGNLVAESLRDYLKRHQEIESKLKKKQARIFLTTENSAHTKELSQLFYGNKINLEAIKLSSRSIISDKNN